MSSVSLITYLPSFARQIFTLHFGRLLPDLPLPDVDLQGKNAVITGGNSGLGYEMALELARRNANVVLACRSEPKALEAVSNIQKELPQSKGKVQFMQLDTSSFKSVRAFAEAWTARHPGQRLDVLANNAGISTTPLKQDFSPEGHDLVYATNLLGSFLLTNLLEPVLAPDARVLFTSSFASNSGKFSTDFLLKGNPNEIEQGFHFASESNASFKSAGEARKTSGRSHSAWYANTKAMQYVFAYLLQRHFDRQPREGGKKRTAHSWSPGFTWTPIYGKVEMDTYDPVFAMLTYMSWLCTTAKAGAVTGAWLCMTDDKSVTEKGGEYWDWRLQREIPGAARMSEKQMERLWTRWENDAGIEW